MTPVTSPMCLGLTFPISQGHGEVHWGVARVCLSGEISSSGCKAEQTLQRGLGLGTRSPGRARGLGRSSDYPLCSHRSAGCCVVLDKSLTSLMNVANRISTSRVSEARRVWVLNPVGQIPVLFLLPPVPTSILWAKQAAATHPKSCSSRAQTLPRPSGFLQSHVGL